MNIAVLGFGIEGKATHRFLKRKFPKAHISILDQKTDRAYLERLTDFDVVYRSPGIPYNLKEIQRAIKKGVVVTSATDTFLEGARGIVVGVTGTKGKSTTATLIYEILKAAGRDVYLAGNIGKPALNLLPKLRKNSITILELSSFQLQGVMRSPHIAVVLNIFPDHLDAHKNFKEYLEAKSQIAAHQNSNDVIFFPSASDSAAAVAKRGKGRKVAVPVKQFPIDLKIAGVHNLQNAAMAAAVASHLDVSPVTILKITSTFRGLPYRLAPAGRIGGVALYNDSASTNPQTTVAALDAFPGKQKVLIAGGRDKNLDYKPLKAALKRDDVRAVILFGENKMRLKKLLTGVLPVRTATNLERAAAASLRIAEPGDVVLFSPGAASFDMFEDYRERGREFDRIVKNLRG